MFFPCSSSRIFFCVSGRVRVHRGRLGKNWWGPQNCFVACIFWYEFLPTPPNSSACFLRVNVSICLHLHLCRSVLQKCTRPRHWPHANTREETVGCGKTEKVERAERRLRQTIQSPATGVCRRGNTRISSPPSFLHGRSRGGRRHLPSRTQTLAAHDTRGLVLNGVFVLFCCGLPSLLPFFRARGLSVWCRRRNKQRRKDR